MKKRAFSLLLVLLIAAVLCVSVSAAGTPGSRLVDQSGMLSGSEAAAISATLDRISNEQQFDVVIVTSDNLGGKGAVAYADDYFDEHGYGYGADYDGALMLISMEPNNRRCHISTSGRGIDILDDNTIDHMLDIIVDDHLADGEYYEAMAAFADLCESYLTGDIDGYPSDTRSSGDDEKSPGLWATIGSAIGLIVGGIRNQSLKSQMKSVHSRSEANYYIRDNSMTITDSSEIYLYHTVNRVRRETDRSSGGGSSTHISSSGRTHGGGGRSF